MTGITSPGYSGTPLAKKLGYKAGTSVVTIGAPENYLAILEPLPDGVAFQRTATSETDLVHLFTVEREELARHLGVLRKKLKPDAAVWVWLPRSKATSLKTSFAK